MNLKHYIIKKLGGYTKEEIIDEQWIKNKLDEYNKGTYHKLVAEDYGKSFPIINGKKENCVDCKNLPEGEVKKGHDHREFHPPETVFYGTSYSKLPKHSKILKSMTGSNMTGGKWKFSNKIIDITSTDQFKELCKLAESEIKEWKKFLKDIKTMRLKNKKCKKT